MTDKALAVSQAKYWHLRQVDLFNGVANLEIRQLGEAVDIEIHEQGQTVYRAGDLADRIYVLKSGRIKISRASDGDKELILYFIRPGDVFGELAVTGQGVRSSTATVLEDAVVCAVGGPQLEGFIARHPEVALQISRVIGERKQRIERRVLDLVTKDVRTRLAHTLAALAEEFGEEDGEGATRIDLRLTQSELAQLVGSTRETTSTVFNEFRRQGLVDSEGRVIRVLDQQALVEYRWVPHAA